MMITWHRTRFNNCRRLVRFCAALATVLILACVFGGGRREHAAGAPDSVRHPILLELFTSEGCSSCPPVDAWVQTLDSSQPIPDAQIIVLSEHVDYWDHDGWKDQYSSALLTERQRDYAQRLGLSDVYTPQLILDGSGELHPNDSRQVEQAFEKAAADAVVPLRIESVGIEAESPGVLKGRIAVDGGRQPDVVSFSNNEHGSRWQPGGRAQFRSGE